MQLGEYKGHKLLILSKGPDDKFPFQMGLTKAKLVLEHLDDVRKFVAMETRGQSANPPVDKSAAKKPWVKARR